MKTLQAKSPALDRDCHKHGDSHTGAQLEGRVRPDMLSAATNGGHEAMLKLLTELDDVETDSKDSSGLTSLFWVAWEHEATVKEAMVEHCCHGQDTMRP